MRMITNGLKRFFAIFLIIMLSCLFLWVAALFLTRIPVYINLPVQSVSALKSKGDWSKVEHTFLELDGGDYFIEKKYDVIFTNNKGDNSTSLDEIASYFDTWLSNHGWKRFNGFLPRPCDNFLAESELLTQGKSSISTYFKSNPQDPFLNQPTVCLEVWEVESEGKTNKNSIVLLTASPTILTTILNVFR